MARLKQEVQTGSTKHPSVTDQVHQRESRAPPSSHAPRCHTAPTVLPSTHQVDQEEARLLAVHVRRQLAVQGLLQAGAHGDAAEGRREVDVDDLRKRGGGDIGTFELGSSSYYL